jgi:hypothetical protein
MIKPEDLQNKMFKMTEASTEVVNKEPAYNIIIVNTPRGKMTIKTYLTGKEWIAEQELRLKNQPKKKPRCKRK